MANSDSKKRKPPHTVSLGHSATAAIYSDVRNEFRQTLVVFLFIFVYFLNTQLPTIFQNVNKKSPKISTNRQKC